MSFKNVDKIDRFLILKFVILLVLDSTGKITSGLLKGNINQFGDFEMCTQIKTLIKVTPEQPMRVRGKYCLAHIETHTDVAELKVPVHFAHGRGLWNSHLGNVSGNLIKKIFKL